MSHDEEQQRRSRVVVQTPTSRREEVYTHRERVPERDRNGYSTGVVAAVALVAVAATALIMFFWMNSSSDATNANVSVTTTQPTPLPTVPTPLVVQPTPLVQQTPPPVIVQPPPATTTQPAPVIIAPPATSSPAPAATPSVPDDATLESALNKTFADDADLATVNISVANGKVTLIGSVKSADLKARAERLARTVKGVRNVDNRIVVEGGAPIP